MLKKFWPILIIPFVVSCATLAIPKPSDVDRASTRWPGVQLADLNMGRKLYVAHCAGCHPLHLPSEYTIDEWSKKVPEMAKKAKFKKSEQKIVLEYVTTFAQDANN